MRASGVVIMGCFAAVWWGAAGHLGGTGSVAWYGAGVAVSLALIMAALRAGRRGAPLDEATGRRIARLVGWASAAEGVGMLVAVNVLTWVGLADYFVCAAAVIVGLHFVPLARLPHAGSYLVTAAALVAVGTLGCLLPLPARGLFVGCGAALVVWATCLNVVFGFRRRSGGGIAGVVIAGH